MAVTPQQTIAKSSDWIGGQQLDAAARAAIRLHPAPPDSGIVFVRSDLPGGPEVKTCPANLRSMPRWTALEEGGAEVHHTEHLLAALTLCGVDNVKVEMDCSRIPMVEGCSSAGFCEVLVKAGRRTLDARRRVFTLKAPFFYLDSQRTSGEVARQPLLQDGRYVIGVPSDRLSLSYVFHWAHLETLPIGVAEYEEGDGTIDPTLVSARSYLVETESESVRELLGPVQADVLKLYPHCPPALAQEAARHKILDFVGDLMILGRPLVSRFVAFRTGHRIHHDLVRYLVSSKLLDLVEA